jgi:hypothetical protein
MIPARPSPTSATSSENPDRPAALAPDRPRSSSTTTTWCAGQPSSTARCRRSYCRARLSVCTRACSSVDCRTYTYASRARCDAVIFPSAISSAGPAARPVTGRLLPAVPAAAVQHTAGDDPGQQRQDLAPDLPGRPSHRPPGSPPLPNRASWRTGAILSTRIGLPLLNWCGAIRDEVNLFALSPREHPGRPHQPRPRPRPPRTSARAAAASPPRPAQSPAQPARQPPARPSRPPGSCPASHPATRQPAAAPRATA